MKPNIDGVTRWRRVADDIRTNIDDGVISDALPSEFELAARYGVNRHTIRRAIAALTADGLLRVERGRGTFVNSKPQRIVYPIGSRTRFSENMLKQSLEPSGRLIKSDYVVSDSVLAPLLECRVGTRLHRLDSLSVANGVPLSRSTSYFSAERFPGIVDAYAETGSITEALRREGIVDYRRRETRLTAERVSAKDAELMSCASDAVVLISKAIDVDLEGQPIQFIRTKFLADRVELVMLQS
ncbi:phosphonate metabolism transcriptional regulator PhnF [Microvirga mediterraneensis]|uniref:Phosphonate metabolism transcriptional regulator PhnF n=1 Tax=Microvirga mediterraneensis TaxID=2754695 RepID=A0A838BJN8_9HYPH|nr:phosphonate metabolism transcriptional regulator PhnF [Microvirga mediterraneensis]MBA1155385.1 phosphonate metabolism transcriptional regulator PhnF [Microvirga mediterraneensis]